MVLGSCYRASQTSPHPHTAELKFLGCLIDSLPCSKGYIQLQNLPDYDRYWSDYYAGAITMKTCWK